MENIPKSKADNQLPFSNIVWNGITVHSEILTEHFKLFKWWREKESRWSALDFGIISKFNIHFLLAAISILCRFCLIQNWYTMTEMLWKLCSPGILVFLMPNLSLILKGNYIPSKIFDINQTCCFRGLLNLASFLSIHYTLARRFG